MSQLSHQFTLELFDDHGAALGGRRFQPDTTPAVEYARLEGIRSGVLPPVTAAAAVKVEPIWHPRDGQPYVNGLRATVVSRVVPQSAPLSVAVPGTCFNAAARRVAADFVAEGLLKDGDRFRYKVTAVSQSAPAASADANFEEVSQSLNIANTPIEQFLRGTAAPAAQMPVFIAPEVLEQANAQCAAADSVETGGILLGRLHRDTTDRGLLFLEITAQVPATHTVQRSTRLTFTAQTWTAARAAMRLGGSSESIVGWWHFHPDWCRACTAEKQAQCAYAGIFFSADDCALHRAVFSLAHQVGLLISDRGGVMTPALFGWTRGIVTSRTLQFAQPQPVTVGGSEHEIRTHGE